MSSIQTTSACALGLTHETLSALRDGLLTAGERERLNEHVASCAACQARLADFDAIAGELRRERVPIPDERLWRGMREAITSAPQTSRMSSRISALRLPTGPRAKQLWGTLGAAAAILLVVIGFARLLYVPRGTQQPVTLAWQAVALPDGLSIGLAQVFPAPGDGRSAYLCAANRVWTTSDTGLHWARVGDLPAAQDGTCRIVVDAGDARLAVAQVTTGSGEAGTLTTASFLSRDGGNTWASFGSNVGLLQLASAGGVTYGLGSDLTPNLDRTALAISTDGLRSWQVIDQSILAIAGQNQAVGAFWLNPTDGDVLVQVGTSLWQTSDRGAHWTPLANSDAFYFVVQRPVAGQPWHICGVRTLNADHAPNNEFKCSTDGSRTWTNLPELDFTLHCDTCYKGKPNTTLSVAQPVGLADDGAFLIELPTKMTDSGNTNDVVYRLLPGSTQWQSLGELPQGNDRGILFPWSGHTLWAFPSGQLFTAIYPPNAPLPNPGPTLTPTPPAHPLSWQVGAAPIHLTREVDPPVLAPSPADGRVAYLCGADWTSTNTDVQPQVWVTTDRAAHWNLITTMPVQRHYNGCQVAASQTDAASAVVTMTYTGATPASNAEASYFTADYGASWGLVGGSGGYVTQLASKGTAAYLLYSAGDQPPQLFVAAFSSLTDPRVWRRLDANLPAPVQRFWLNPTTGALLVALDASSAQSRLYQSADGGKSWSAIQAPKFDFIAVVQPTTSSAPWHICLTAAAPSGQDGAISCSADGGQTWTDRPVFASTQATACTGCTSPVRALRPANAVGDSHVGLAGDGSLLEIENTGTGSNGSPQFVLYRLGPNTTQWQSLGPIPELYLGYSGGPGAGVLWALPAAGIEIDSQQRPFTADYPS